MQRKKRGFWLFIFSLIPGAGEMYLGFRRQGISTMFLFFSVFAIAGATGMGGLVMLCPIIWFYSFFNVHNLKSLPDEEFYSMEDSYILHLEQILGDTDKLLKKHRKAIAILLIILGASILWNNISDVLCWILPSPLADFFRSFSYRLPQLTVGTGILLAGLYVLSDRKNRLTDSDSPEKEEHYWEPYRPYQQPREDVRKPDALKYPACETPSAPQPSPENGSAVPQPEDSAAPDTETNEPEELPPYPEA